MGTRSFGFQISKCAILTSLMLAIIVIASCSQVISEGTLPDITIAEAGVMDLNQNVITGSIEVREQFYVWWTVKNLGDVPSGGYDTWLYIPEGELKYMNAPSWYYSFKDHIIFKREAERQKLDPGQSATWYMTAPCYLLESGSFEFRVVANPDVGNGYHIMKESDYDNNEYSFTVNVGVVETTSKTTYSASSTAFSTPSTTAPTTMTKMIVTTETVAVSAGWSEQNIYIAAAIVAVALIALAFFFMHRRGARPTSVPSAPLSADMKYCVQCGTNLEKTAEFCNKCGAKQ